MVCTHMCMHVHVHVCMCTCAHVLMHCCNCVCVHVCMCTCAKVLLQWCQWCLCAWACAYTHHACVHVLLCCCACACCLCICVSKPFAPSTHMCNHTHEKGILKQGTCILKQATTVLACTAMLACNADTAMAKKITQNCSRMLSMRLTSTCPLVHQVTDLHASWAILPEVLTML